METNTQRWTTIILLVGEASGVFAGFCPSWFTVASPFFHEQEAKDGNVKRIRAGEVAATAIVLATGAAVSQSMNDPVPFVAARPRPLRAREPSIGSRAWIAASVGSDGIKPLSSN